VNDLKEENKLEQRIKRLEKKRWIYGMSLSVLFIIWIIIYSTTEVDFVDILQPYIDSFIMTVVTFFVFLIIYKIYQLLKYLYEEEKRKNSEEQSKSPIEKED